MCRIMAGADRHRDPGEDGPMSAAERAARRAGLLLASAAVVNVVAEAVVAAAWERRPYSYVDDNVAYLGSSDVGPYHGVVVSSPLWPLMETVWVLSGVVVGAAGVLLARLLPRRAGITVAAVAVVEAVGFVLFAVVRQGPSTEADGTIAWHYVGAALVIAAGNALPIAVGLAGRRLGLPRSTALVGVGLGALGLVSAATTFGWLALGLAERISIYSFLLWQVVVGVALARRSPASGNRGGVGSA